jgi:hypothetical protein
MTPERDTDGGPDAAAAGRCRATLRTTHADPAVVASALTPDNTAEMGTRTDDGQVVTTIARDSPGGLRSTVDDYVVNLQVADSIADEHRSDTP